MLALTALRLSILAAVRLQQPPQYTVTVGDQLGATSGAYVCWNIDASENRGFFWRNLSASSTYGAKLARQASALARGQATGHSYLRFGGSGNDFLTYAFGGTVCPPPSTYRHCLNETHWRGLLSFTAAANARMIFGLSLNTGPDLDDGQPYPFPWDPSNARQILQWTIAQRLDHLLLGFELGNEQNTRFTGDQMAHNAAILQNLTIELWPDATRRPRLFGPDPHGFHAAHDSRTATNLAWLQAWLRGCAARGVPIEGVTHHEYIEVGNGSFADAAKLDLSAAIGRVTQQAVRAVDRQVGIWAGEIGPHNGGSPVCSHASMRWAVYGDSIWYADALGAKARAGYAGFCRQDYIGADYGMLDCASGAPLPDYFTALAFTTTMGAIVLNASAAQAAAPLLRVYAHCTALAEQGKAANGGVTLLVISLSDAPLSLAFDAALGGAQRAYVLAPSDDPSSSLTGRAGLLGTGITLNGELLAAGANGSVARLAPAPLDGASAVTVPPHAIGFYVFPTADHPACPWS
eukprot:Transcript_28961.p1 GENE.Transcript_28961~~Transcript_28961.p1  ORF type:complete len:519 (+),score=159.28 Transcript_28961:104-1660(+)